MLFQKLPVISSMSERIFDSIWATKDHSQNYCELIHVRKGSFTHLSNAGRFKAEADDCIITPSQTMHRDIFDPIVGLEVFIIFFSWSLEIEYLQCVNNANINQISADTKIAVDRIFDEMRLDPGGHETDKLVASSRLFTILMLFYRDIFQSQNPDSTDESINRSQWLVNEAKKYLEKHYQQPVKLEDVAENLQVSPFYLSRIFSRESNFSLFEYLNGVRMRKARELLHEGRHIVADVAHLTGFEESNYFSKVYKRYYGHSPSQSRFN